MLELPRNGTGGRTTSHMLVVHGGEIFLHSLLIGRSSRIGSESSRHSHYSSRSPSPLAGTERHQSAPGIRSGRSPSPSRNNAPVSDRSRAWVKERAGLLSTGWIPSPNVPVPIPLSPPSANNLPSSGESGNVFLLARQRFEAAQSRAAERVNNTTSTSSTSSSSTTSSSNRIQSVENLDESFEMRSNSSSSVRTVELNETGSSLNNKSFVRSPSETAVRCDESEEDSSCKNGGGELLSTDSGIVVHSPSALPTDAGPVAAVEAVIEETLDRIDKPESSPVQEAGRALAPLNNSVQENEEVFYDNSVTSARFDEWQLRTPTQLDDSPVFKSATLDFDALVSDDDEAKQLEPDDEKLFRTSSEMSETDLSPLSSPPPEFCKEAASPAPPST